MSGTRPSQSARRGRGFARAATLVAARIRMAGESRGFAVSRLLTHWEEIAGPDLGRLTRPVEVKYGRAGLGATLTLLVPGARAPMVEMQKERLRARVNACYGYAAIAAIRLTQTAPAGFAEPAAAYEPAPSPARRDAAERLAGEIADPALRDALAALGANVLSRNQSR